MTTPLDEAVERHGEALFNLSDSIRESGMLDSDKHHQRYEATVKAWNDLRTILNALSPDEERVALERALDRMGWPEIDAFRDELRKGQDVYEDAGGYFMRAIKALFGIKPRDPMLTYQEAARALIEEASRVSPDEERCQQCGKKGGGHHPNCIIQSIVGEGR
jgi:hypothetical protein